MDTTFETREHAQHILNYIEAFPDKHDQESWFRVPGDRFRNVGVTEENFCGTTMCIAGTSVFLKQGIDHLKSDTSFESIAGLNLGLSDIESNRLFYTMSKEKAKSMLRSIVKGDEREFNLIYDEVTDHDEDED